MVVSGRASDVKILHQYSRLVRGATVRASMEPQYVMLWGKWTSNENHDDDDEIIGYYFGILTANHTNSNILAFCVLVTNKAKDRAQGQGQGLYAQGQGLYSQGQGQGLSKCP